MLDVIQALEPDYAKFEQQQEKGVITADFVIKAAKYFNLWIDPTQTICGEGPIDGFRCNAYSGKIEYIEEAATLENELHLDVMGIFQPLYVNEKDGHVAGFCGLVMFLKSPAQPLLGCSVS